MAEQHNDIKELLIALGICDESSLERFYPKVRDRDDISVLRCTKSGVIFLSRSDHMEMSYYESKEGFDYWSAEDRKQAVNANREDILRRKELLRPLVTNRKWLDIGTGYGGILDAVAPLASAAIAVEPQKSARQSLGKLGYEVHPSIESVTRSGFEVVTLFHVFEHFTKPLQDLKSIRRKMADQGTILIEVPHANDFLISFLEHEGFKKFTFWSEHLILHTRPSLTRFLESAGFQDIAVSGCQRYPLANHLYWLSKNRPGGHREWPFLRTAELDSAYTRMLAKLDRTDTLVATAVKRSG